MKKKKKFRPFSRRLTRRLVLTLFIVLSLLCTWIVLIGWAMVVIQTEFNYVNQLHLCKEKIQQVMSDIHVATVNLVPEIEANLDRPDALPRITERMVRLNPNIRSCGISFVEGYYPKKGRAYCPYTVRNDSLGTKVCNPVTKSNNYLEAEWFKEAIAADSGYWSKPFADGNDKKTPLVAYMVPIHDRERNTVAVLGVDMSLEWLNDYMGNADGTLLDYQDDGFTISVIFGSTYLFVIDKEGTYILYPDKERILKENYFTRAKETPDTLDDYLGHQMVANRVGVFHEDDHDKELILNGESSYAFYQPMKTTDWSIALVVPWFAVNMWAIALTIALVFFMVVGLLVTFFVSSRMVRHATKPLKQLAASAGEVAQGRFDAPLPNIRHNDEIRLLRDSFENMQHSLTDYVAKLQSTTAQKASMESELKIAHDIQMSMLPKTFPPFPERQDIDVFGQLMPARAVGGDLFDFYIREEKLLFCIGDVSGKGVPASLLMAVTRSLFRNISSYTSEPNQIVMALNSVMSEDNETNMFVTLFVGMLDLGSHELHYCNAGHDAPLLIGPDVSLLPCDSNLPVGVMSGWEFTMQTTTLAPGTTIFLYTDGLNEAENAVHAQFGDDRILGVAHSLAAINCCQPDAVIDRMGTAVHDFVGDAEQSDDLTMLAVQLK